MFDINLSQWETTNHISTARGKNNFKSKTQRVPQITEPSGKKRESHIMQGLQSKC